MADVRKKKYKAGDRECAFCSKSAVTQVSTSSKRTDKLYVCKGHERRAADDLTRSW